MTKKTVHFSRRRVLVVGDLIVDIHHYSSDVRKSSEENVFAASHKKSLMSWGGAGLVARNILSLGGLPTFVSVLGDDDYAKQVESFSRKNLKKMFFREKGRRTMVKERFLINGKKVLRWNRGDSKPVSKKTERDIFHFVKNSLKSFDTLLISDYRHGVMTRSLAQSLIKEARKNKKPVYVDSQIVQGGKGNHRWYRGATLVCLNKGEAESVDRKFSEKNIKRSLKRLSGIIGVQDVVVKLGEKGSASFIGNNYFFTPAYKVTAVDPVGAGDAFFAVLGALSRDLSPQDLALANTWAALATTMRGTEPPTPNMLRLMSEKKKKIT